MMALADRDIARPWLGMMATGELAERERIYPERVRQGRMAEDEAATTIRVWQAIATLFSQRSAATGLSWAELEHELRRSFGAICESCDRNPGDQARVERREAIAAMLARVRWHRSLTMGEPAEGRAAA